MKSELHKPLFRQLVLFSQCIHVCQKNILWIASTARSNHFYATSKLACSLQKTFLSHNNTSGFVWRHALGHFCFWLLWRPQVGVHQHWVLDVGMATCRESRQPQYLSAWPRHSTHYKIQHIITAVILQQPFKPNTRLTLNFVNFKLQYLCKRMRSHFHL